MMYIPGSLFVKPSPPGTRPRSRCSFEEAVVSFSGLCCFSSEGAKWLFTGNWGCQLSRGGRCTSQGDTVQKQTPTPTGKERQDPAEIQWASMSLWSQRNCYMPCHKEWTTLTIYVIWPMFFLVLQKRYCKWLNHHHMCNQSICLSFQPANINSKILTVAM